MYNRNLERNNMDWCCKATTAGDFTDRCNECCINCSMRNDIRDDCRTCEINWALNFIQGDDED